MHCEVLACDPPKLLRYSWKGGSDSNPAKGSRLDSELTWTLTPVDGGTHLKMVHDGFVLPDNQMAYDAMSPGWGRIMDSVARVTAETADHGCEIVRHQPFRDQLAARQRPPDLFRRIGQHLLDDDRTRLTHHSISFSNCSRFSNRSRQNVW